MNTMPKRPQRHNMVKVGGYDVSPTSEIFQEKTPQKRVVPVVAKKVAFKKGPGKGKGKPKRKPRRSPPPGKESLIEPDDDTLEKADGAAAEVAEKLVEGVAVIPPII